jgi:hypothetical protein
MIGIYNPKGVQTTSGEGAVDRMERDIINCVYQSLVFSIGSRVTTMAFERKIAPVR